MLISQHSLGKHVRHISSNGSIKNGKFQHLVRQCPNLQSLRLGAHQLKPKFYQIMAQRCPQLVSLQLFNLWCLSTNLLATFARFSHLETLDVSVHLLHNTYQWTTTENTVMDLALFPQLKRLALDNMPTPFLRRYLTTNNNNNNNQYHAAAYPRLQSLLLSQCHQLNDNDIIPFLASQPGLKQLELSGGGYTDATLDAIITHVSGVVRLDLAFTRTLTAPGLRRVIDSCHHLVSIQLNHCGFLKRDFADILDPASINLDSPLKFLAINKIRAHSHHPNRKNDDDQSNANGQNNDNEWQQ